MIFRILGLTLVLAFITVYGSAAIAFVMPIIMATGIVGPMALIGLILMFFMVGSTSTITYEDTVVDKYTGEHERVIVREEFSMNDMYDEGVGALGSAVGKVALFLFILFLLGVFLPVI